MSEAERKVIDKQLKRAKKKFKQMDEDGNGVLSGAELRQLALWVFDSFHPGGEPLSEERRQAEVRAGLSIYSLIYVADASAWFAGGQAAQAAR